MEEIKSVIATINDLVRESVHRNGVDLREVKLQVNELVSKEVVSTLILNALDDAGGVIDYVASYDIDEDELVCEINHRKIAEEYEMAKIAYEKQCELELKEFWASRKVE